MTTTSNAPQSVWSSLLLKGLWAIMAVFGGMALYQMLANDAGPVGFTSSVPWGLWVAAYIYFCGLSAGAFLIAACGYMTQNRVLMQIMRPCLLLAFAALSMGLLSVALDLGHIWRAFSVFTRPQFHSVMAWMVWIYSLYFILLLLLLLRAEAPSAGAVPSPSHWWIGLAGMLLALVIAGGPGALLGTVVAREYWNTPLYPVFFMVGGITTAAGFITAFAGWSRQPFAERTDLLGRLRTCLGILVMVELVFVAAEYLIPVWYGIGSASDLALYVLFGPYWYVFWIVQLLLGVVIPLALLAFVPSAGGLGLAGALVGVTFFAVRLNLVIPGLIMPQIQGIDTAYTDPVGGKLAASYSPTLFEWQVLIGILAVGIAIWYLGNRVFHISPARSSQTNEVHS